MEDVLIEVENLALSGGTLSDYLMNSFPKIEYKSERTVLRKIKEVKFYDLTQWSDIDLVRQIILKHSEKEHDQDPYNVFTIGIGMFETRFENPKPRNPSPDANPDTRCLLPTTNADLIEYAKTLYETCSSATQNAPKSLEIWDFKTYYDLHIIPEWIERHRGDIHPNRIAILGAGKFATTYYQYLSPLYQVLYTRFILPNEQARLQQVFVQTFEKAVRIFAFDSEYDSHLFAEFVKIHTNDKRSFHEFIFTYKKNIGRLQQPKYVYKDEKPFIIAKDRELQHKLSPLIAKLG
uniref:Mde8i18_4 n=1 Tax=Mayetiola destructor TaxID=39758 RepID=Q3HM46_MAYDE|nr:Mde8i18_4 [Mayetiola destructor]